MAASTLVEDAKSDWLNLVKKHRKKQKGLPSQATLNDAGDVETCIKMFNKINTTGSANTNPVSGPFSKDVSTSDSTALTEHVYTEDVNMNQKTIKLYYPELAIEDAPTGKYYPGDRFTRDEPDYADTTIEYEYTVDEIDVIEFLQDLPEFIEKYDLDSFSDEEIHRFIHSNIDSLTDEYMDKLLSHFEEFAISDALDKFDFERHFDNEPDYDPYDRYNESKTKDNLDDEFDMSLRALL